MPDPRRQPSVIVSRSLAHTCVSIGIHCITNIAEANKIDFVKPTRAFGFLPLWTSGHNRPFAAQHIVCNHSALSSACVTGLLAALLFMSGCNRVDEVETTGLPQGLPGAYTGTFPCDGCPGIPTRLWIRDDGIYFFEQRYSQDGSGGEPVTSLGRWTWSGDRGVLELRGAGPVRQFSRSATDVLVMQTASPLEHSLARDSTLGEFDGSIMVEGTITPGRDEPVFAECLTMRQLRVARGADYSTFARQYRRLGATGAPVFVEFEGRFRWRADGSPEAIEILRFVTIRSGETC